jgi:hypothetical protein
MDLFEEKGLETSVIENLGKSIDELAEATSENTNATRNE